MESRKEVEEERIVIKKFNINKINVGDCVVIIGKRGSGKTTLIKHILNKKDIRKINVMSDMYDSSIITEVLEDFDDRVLVMDESIKDNKPDLHKIFINKKYSNILTLIGTQMDDIPTVIRTNTDYLIVMDMSFIGMLYNKYSLNFMRSYARFNEIIRELMKEPYVCMVIDIKNKMFYWYKA